MCPSLFVTGTGHWLGIDAASAHPTTSGPLASLSTKVQMTTTDCPFCKVSRRGKICLIISMPCLCHDITQML